MSTASQAGSHFRRMVHTAFMPAHPLVAAGRIALAAVTVGLLLAAAPVVPSGVARALPPGFVVLASARIVVGRPVREFRIVALGRPDEARAVAGRAPARPLIIMERRGGGFVAIARNDAVVRKADEGGQCDPFLDDGGVIAVRGRFFTVENGVSCGQHWSDFITFRFDGARGFVFDNERAEYWRVNFSDAPGADALVRDGPQRVTRDRAGHVTPFAGWRP